MRGRHGWILAWTLCGALAATSARAQDAAAADLRCFVVALNAAASDDSTQKAAGTMMAVYYMGRLDGGTPNLDLKTRLVEEIRKMTPERFKAEAMRCGADMTARASAMADLAGVLATQGGAPPAN